MEVISRPSALAVVRFMTSLNLVGGSICRSGASSFENVAGVTASPLETLS